ncbi:MAG TPA: DUF58 domain-containing protein [Gaiellales bacterium]|nr:DUF58 domain-containing protein [Gaiellales bacterium]
MTSAPTIRLRAYPAICAALLLAAVGLRRPELVAVAAPFGLVAAVGLARSAPPQVEAHIVPGDLRALEGDRVTAVVELAAARAAWQVDVGLGVPEGLASVDGPPRRAVRPAAGASSVGFELECARWGGYTVPARILVHEPFGLRHWASAAPTPLQVRVHPKLEALRRPPRPVRTQASVGSDTSRLAGEGLEFADLRPYREGDRLRRVNWRVSARRGTLHTNLHHPERNADVIIFLDSFAESPVSLDLAVRAASTLATAYLEERDRVGVVGFGGVLRWVLPSTGRAQTYRVLDSLIDTEVVTSYAWRDVDVIPTRTLPPGALVLALTPLADDRALAALAALRARGFDLAVVDVSATARTPAAAGELGELAHRLWVLRHEGLRSRYRRLGVPVVEWDGLEPLAGTLAQLREARRYARTVRS